MIGHYLMTAVSNLRKNKLFSVINIFGLALGLAAFMLITLFVLNEYSYDRHWQNADRIYRVHQVVTLPEGEADRANGASHYLLSVLKDFFPNEIELGARRLSTTMVTLSVGEQSVTTDVGNGISYVDPEFIEIFQIHTLSGDFANVFSDINSIALSRDMARDLFGDENPIGRTLSALFYDGDKKEYEVGAVYELEEGNSVFSFPALALFDDAELINNPNWVDSRTETILRVSDKTDQAIIQGKLSTIIDEHVVPTDWLAALLSQDQAVSDVFSYELQAVPDIYLDVDRAVWPYGPDGPLDLGNPSFVTVLGFIAMLVLLIACTNYVIEGVQNSVSAKQS